LKRITKTESLRHAIFRDILYGKYSPGEKLPTEREMSEQTGSSRIIVRQAYAELEQAGVLERIQGSGTFVAKTSAGNSQNRDMIAMLTSVRDAFSLEFLEATEKAISDADAVMILKLTEEDPAKEEAAAIELVARGIRNLIVWPSGRSLAAATFERLRVLGTNMVFFDRVIPGNYADYIGVDNAHAVRTLLTHAQKNGARHFAFINHEGEFADTDMLRQKTFEQWARQEGVEHEVATVPWRGNYAGAIQDKLHRWTKIGKTMAIVCVNDYVACAIKEVVGDRLAVYGIDGLPEAKTLGVTSYRQPMMQMANEAVEMIRRQQYLGSEWKAVQKYCRSKLIHQ
jgi:DNA-binding LacI/PurR family transcriptional regulator